MNDTSKYYKILEIDKSTNNEDIKKAYKKAAIKWHPDKWSREDAEKKKSSRRKIQRNWNSL